MTSPRSGVCNGGSGGGGGGASGGSGRSKERSRRMMDKWRHLRENDKSKFLVITLLPNCRGLSDSLCYQRSVELRGEILMKKERKRERIHA